MALSGKRPNRRIGRGRIIAARNGTPRYPRPRSNHIRIVALVRDAHQVFGGAKECHNFRRRRQQGNNPHGVTGFARYTSFPPTYVAITLVLSTSSAGMRMIS